MSILFKKSFFSIALLFLIISCGNTQVVETSKEFPANNLQEFYIECNVDSFNRMYKNYKENTYIPIKITTESSTHTAKMRVRGDTSREDDKKSLKIKFDSTSFNIDETVFNLNAEYSDKTLIRQYLSSHLMQQAGQICFNSDLIKLFLNGKYLGLYLKVENIGKPFLKRNNLSPKGNLYKATKDGACLSIFDNIPIKWEKKTNKKSDYNDLTNLIEQLNSVSDEEFHSFIKNTFEYDQLINILSLNMFLSNSSTYYHNYYLYHDLYGTGKWQMLPWDMDKSLSYYNWMPYTYHRTSSEWESDNPLVERAILCKPMFNDIQKRLNELHKSNFNNAYITPIIDELITLIDPVVEKDTTDKIKNKKEWLSTISNEKKYFDNHYSLLQKQFNEQPLSFKVHRFKKTQTKSITFKWNTSIHKQNKPISYILTYGTDFLLKDSAKTNYITNITDTSYTLKQQLDEGKYYWKVTAFDGKYYTDGFNTKNILEVKRGTELPVSITKNITLTKDKSPYTTKEKITIKSEATLTIEAGVEIHLAQDAVIECLGNIIAKGTKELPVVLMPSNNANNWDHIYFYNKSKKSIFEHTLLKDGVINAKNTSLKLYNSSILIDKKFMGDGWDHRKVLMYGNNSTIHIDKCTFIGNGEGEGLVLFHGDLTTENSFFNNVPDAIEYISVNKGVIRNNYVTKSPDDAVDLNNCNNILIENNILIDNKDKAISIGTEQYGASINNIHINNNLIIRNKTAIAIKDSSVAHISNNTLFKNKYGINLYKKRDDYLVGGTGYVRNTIFEKNEKTNAYPDEFSKVEVNNSIVTSKVLSGKNNLKGDPGFIDASRNNFNLKPNSQCINKADDGGDIGAFNSNATSISLDIIHVKSNKTAKTGDYITIKNNYNLDKDLSLYTIKIVSEKKEKEFTFPIGTTLFHLQKLAISNKYYSFIKVNKTKYGQVIGGLPKLSPNKTTIQLINPVGFVIDSYSYENIITKPEQGISIVSNGINDKLKKKWSVIIE